MTLVTYGLNSLWWYQLAELKFFAISSVSLGGKKLTKNYISILSNAENWVL